MAHYIAKTIYIDAPYFVAVVMPGCMASTVVHYMENWTQQQILAYCAEKGWKAEII